MFPLRDDNPVSNTPVITYLFIATNIFFWLLVQGMGAEPFFTRSICELGAVPGELLGSVEPGTLIPLTRNTSCVIGAQPNWLTLFSHMFLHGSWFHLLGNMWFLYVFGDNVEDVMGKARFVIFYLLCGLAAVGAQVLSSPGSPVPMVGASGAIGGIMGAYAILFPRAPIHMAIFLGFYIERIAIPAYVMLGYWLVIQLIGAIPTVGGESGGVAFWAHMGGFAAGAVLVFLFKNRRLVELHYQEISRRKYGGGFTLRRSEFKREELEGEE